jgi:MYND finger
MVSDGIDGAEREPYEPANGSWVAELEAAKSELVAATAATVPQPQRSGGNTDECGDGLAADAALLLHHAHLRICRAYCMLRQWERLLASSKKGWALFKSCSSSFSSGNANAARRVEGSLREYRKRARIELAVTSILKVKGYGNASQSGLSGSIEAASDRDPCTDAGLDLRSRLYHMAIIQGRVPNGIRMGTSIFANTNLFQETVLGGDLRVMEYMCALGAPIDYPFRLFREPGALSSGQTITLPREASALVMSCVILAIADSTCDRWAYARIKVPREPDALNRIAECAMQLVRLGADVQRTLNLSGDPPYEGLFLLPELDGKTAFQIAAMSKRRALVALMWEHMQLPPEDRAELVHCRCGSRLPWKMCHSTGVGQPPHYVTRQDMTSYRYSPLSRCPCDSGAKTYYKCCWKDNSEPKYLVDRAGIRWATSDSQSRINELMNWTHKGDPAQAQFFDEFRKMKASYWESTESFANSPTSFFGVLDAAGPKTRMATWDWQVYVGCYKRLHRPIAWVDVHWDLDRAELLRRARNWNEALQKYCDDMGLQGEERERVVEKHTANPCAPCGFIGCDAFETRVREFERCAQCKAIAYCGRRCQRKDWDEHQKLCNVAPVQDAETVVADPERDGEQPTS